MYRHDRPFTIRTHKTLEEILQHYAGDGVATGEEILAIQDSAQMIGCWGFTYPNLHEIHIWHDGKRTLVELADLIGHEIGHGVGTPLKNDDAEEARADQYGAFAVTLIKALRRLKAL